MTGGDSRDDGVTIRPAAVADADTIGRLLADGLGFDLERLGHIEERLADDHPKGMRVVVAECGGDVVGVAAFVVVHVLEYAAPQARLSAIAVAGEHRGRGLGRDLVASVEAHARAAGCFRVELTSAHGLVQAHDFWRQLGYRDSGLRFVTYLDER